MIVVLHQLKVRGAIIISILVVTAIATALGLNEFKGVVTCTVEQVDNKEYENDAHHTCCK
jgi:xanthine/uracil/vitamin C permease (AzgA family)